MENKGCCKEKSADNSCSTEKTGSCGEKTGACGDKSQCCPVTVLKGAFVGGLVMFIYFSISWMLLPWHKAVAALNNGHVEPQVMAKYFLFCLFGAALLTKILKKRRGGCCPVAGSMIIGLLVASFSYLPNVIWSHVPLHDALVGMADDIIAITLAGAVIGKCALKSGGDKGQCGDKQGSCGNK